MSSTAVNADRGRDAKGAARRTSGEQLVDVPAVERDHGDDLLGEHVQRVGGHLQRLDGARAHPLGDDRRLHQVAAVLGEEHAAGDLADLVPGAADALQAAGHRRRRLDLHDQVDRAHVDAELQAGGGDHGGSRPALRSSSIRARCSLETEPWCARASTGGAPWRRARPAP